MDTFTETKTFDLCCSRRNFLKIAGGVAAGSLLDTALSPVESFATSMQRSLSTRKNSRPNIVFIFTDQERYLGSAAKGLVLDGHERLQRRGVTFHNHYCPAVMCTSSRAVIMTGLHTPDNGMFENADMPYVNALSTNIPTIGHMLRKAGYYTAYKGKWHLNREFDTDTPERLFTKEMDGYGFSDFVWPGDVLVHTLGGYHHDHMIAGSAISWMREKGRILQDDNKPWALFVSLVNPHDIMYFNTDSPGEKIQDTGNLLMQSSRAPEHPLYRKQWHAPLPSTLHQSLDDPGRPAAHAEFNRAWGYTLGLIPMEEKRWHRFNDFYFNSLHAVDQQLARILEELDALQLNDNTIIIFTSDHGEMGGAHGLRGKGPFAYQEAIHLPLIVSHPDVKGGQHCSSLTGHIDLVPSILSMCGVDAGKREELAGRTLPGKDFSPVLNRPAAADLHAVRTSTLFTYSGIATNDSDLIRIIAEAKASGTDPKVAIKSSGYRPNMKKRGSVRTVFDGRYKFSRYFAPVERNQPKNLDDLFRWNDVELFDLKHDPNELKNLTLDRQQHTDILQQMNSKLEAVIKDEIGADDGREMPKFAGVEWSIDRIDL